MAREYAKSWFSMFTDDDFAHQPYSDKWLYMTLLGQPALNYAGLQPINMRRWRKAMRTDLGMPSENDLEKALIRLEHRGYVFTDDDTGEVLVRSFMRVDEVWRMPNTFKSALRALAHVESPKLAAVLLAELDRMPRTETKSDKLGQEIDQLLRSARTHLEPIAEGITEPFPEPFTEGIPKPLTEGITRPGKTEPIAEGITEGITDGSVVVEVEVESPPVGEDFRGSRVRTGAREAPRSEPGHDPNEPPEPQTTGNDPEPPSRCRKHVNDPDHTDNCGPCANFRKAHDRWTERDRRRQARARSDEARQRSELRAAEIAACDLCDDNGYTGTQVCNHNPDQDAINARGRELLAAEMARLRDNRDAEPSPPDEPNADADSQPPDQR